MPKRNYVTQDYFDKKFEEVDQKFEGVNRLINELHKKFDKLFENIDWFIGKYSKFEQEQQLLSERVSKHTDNLEEINQKLGIQL